MALSATCVLSMSQDPNDRVVHNPFEVRDTRTAAIKPLEVAAFAQKVRDMIECQRLRTIP